MLFCIQRTTDPFHPDLNTVLQFLLSFFNEGLGYSAINTIRSALSSVAVLDNKPVGRHWLVCRFLKSVFNKRPALPRYQVTWDTDIVLNYLKSLPVSSKISIPLLTRKLTMLLILLSGQRCQTIHLLDVRNMTLTFSKVTFTIGDLTKTSRPGHHVQELCFPAFAPDRRLCVVTQLKAYLRRTLDVREAHKRLLLTTRTPVRPASKDTIRRWVRDVMEAAGVNLKIFSPHSTRSAATSKASCSLHLQTILRTAGWSNSSTFAKYYKKPIAQDTLAAELLKNH